MPSPPPNLGGGRTRRRFAPGSGSTRAESDPRRWRVRTRPARAPRRARRRRRVDAGGAGRRARGGCRAPRAAGRARRGDVPGAWTQAMRRGVRRRPRRKPYGARRINVTPWDLCCGDGCARLRAGAVAGGGQVRLARRAGRHGAARGGGRERAATPRTRARARPSWRSPKRRALEARRRRRPPRAPPRRATFRRESPPPRRRRRRLPSRRRGTRRRSAS